MFKKENMPLLAVRLLESAKRGNGRFLEKCAVMGLDPETVHDPETGKSAHEYMLEQDPTWVNRFTRS